MVGHPPCRTLQSLKGWECHPFIRNGERRIKLTLALMSVGSESTVPALGANAEGRLCQPKRLLEPDAELSFSLNSQRCGLQIKGCLLAGHTVFCRAEQ